MHKITPHLWFDKEASEAAEFYVSAFAAFDSLYGKSAIKSATILHDTPSGDAGVVSFELAGESFMAISAGPLFKFNPSVSFILNFDPSKDKNARENLDALWENLSTGGQALMPIGEYPFSKRYGWIQDKYGVSWQLMLTDPSGEERPFIIPSLLFVGAVCGKAEEATDFYIDVFKNSPSDFADKSARGSITRYPAGMEPDKEGTAMFTDFTLLGQWFAAMDSARMHDFNFNEAISLMVSCDDQEEIDYYWSRLSAVPEAEQCGWFKDKYGLSWQITPKALGEMMKGSKEEVSRVTQAFLKMKKFDIEALEKARKG